MALHCIVKTRGARRGTSEVGGEAECGVNWTWVFVRCIRGERRAAFPRNRAREGAWKNVKPWDWGSLALDATTLTLAADGGGYWSGLIVPAVIVIVGLLTAVVVLLVTRDPAVSSGPQVGPEPPVTRDVTPDAPPVTRDVTPDAPPEGPDEDE